MSRLLRPKGREIRRDMRIELDEKTARFQIVDLTLEQLNTILNCIAIVTEKGRDIKKKDKKK